MTTRRRSVSVAACQACHLQAWQLIECTGRCVGALSHDHPDAAAVHSPCDEGEHVNRLLVEPLQVVDHDQDRAGPADLAHQCVNPEAHQESVGGRAEFDPEHHQQRVALRGGQLVDEVPVAQDQLRSAGERGFGLGLRADYSLDRQIRVGFCNVVQQCRLADARITPDDQYTARTGTHRGDQLLQGRALTCPADENVGRILVSWGHRVGRSPRRSSGMRHRSASIAPER